VTSAPQTSTPILSLTLAALLVASSCASGPSQTLISDREIVLSPEGVQFDLPTPFRRRHNSGSVRMELVEEWTPLPPYRSIKLADGRLATLTLVLVSDAGRTFPAASFGAAGGLNARFIPEIPKNALIRAVRASSDVPVHCARAVWYDFDPK